MYEMDDAAQDVVGFLQQHDAVAQYAKMLTAAILISSESVFTVAASYASARRRRSVVYLANAIAIFWDLLRDFRCSREDLERAQRFCSWHKEEAGHWTTYFFLASACTAHTSLAQVRGEHIEDMEVIFERTIEVMVTFGAPCDSRLVEYLQDYNTERAQGYFAGLVDSCRLTTDRGAARLMFMQYVASIGVNRPVELRTHRARLAVDLPKRFSDLLGLT